MTPGNNTSTRWNMYPPGVPVSQLGRTMPILSTWMFAGRPCTTREFADFVWPGDDPQKTAFLLRWEGFAQNP